MQRSVAAKLERLLPGRVSFGVPMKLHTTWRIGGPADFFVEPQGTEELARALAFAREEGLPVTVIGGGSNLLVRDGGIRGLVIKIGSGFSRLEISGERVVAGAGVKLARLCSELLASAELKISQVQTSYGEQMRLLADEQPDSEE